MGNDFYDTAGFGIHPSLARWRSRALLSPGAFGTYSIASINAMLLDDEPLLKLASL